MYWLKSREGHEEQPRGTGHADGHLRHGEGHRRSRA